MPRSLDRIKTFKCPISGFDIQESGDWYYFDSQSSYFLKARLINKNILLLILDGQLNLRIYTEQQAFLERLIESLFPENEKFILVHDYKNLNVQSVRIRLNYIKWVLARNQYLSDVIFYNLSPLQVLYVSSGKLFNKAFKDVHVFKDYKETIQYIEAKLKNKDTNQLSNNENNSFWQYEKQISYLNINNKSIKYLSKPEWIYKSEDSSFVCKYVLYENNIFGRELSGKQTLEDSVQAVKILEKIIEEYVVKGDKCILMVESDSLESVSYKARRHLSNWVNSKSDVFSKIIYIKPQRWLKNLLRVLKVIFININVDFVESKSDVFTQLSYSNINHKREDDVAESTCYNQLFYSKWNISRQYFNYNLKNYRAYYFPQTTSESRNVTEETSIINGKVFYRKIIGDFKTAEDSMFLTNSHDQITAELFPNEIKPIVIFDLSELKSITFEVRKVATEWVLRVSDKTEMFVFFSSNILIRLAVLFSKTINKKYKHYHVFSSKEKALDFVFNHDKDKTVDPDNNLILSKDEKIKQLELELKKTKATINDDKRKLTDLFEILGRVSWDDTYKPIKYDIDDSDMFSDVFNIVTMLQYDIQEIINEKDSLTKKAIESERLKSAFLANMSHEIRTPMNAISGFSNIVIEESDVSDDTKQYLEIINRNANQLLVLINDIIDFSKIEAGQIKINSIDNNINQLLRTTIDSFYVNPKISRTIEPDKVQLTSFLFFENDEDSEAFFDEVRVRQVLNNLIQNAVKFTRKGSINVSYIIINNSIKFTVEDSGIGIPEDRITQIFERFQQADDSTTRTYGGTGLGLSICKGLCELMGGELSVISEEGKGSSFSFSIPYRLTSASRDKIL